MAYVLVIPLAEVCDGSEYSAERLDFIPSGFSPLAKGTRKTSFDTSPHLMLETITHLKTALYFLFATHR